MGPKAAPNLYGHLFSSYTQKALIAFYEKGAAFEFRDLSERSPDNVARWKALWPIGRFPVLEADGEVVVEATCVIEWLDAREPTRAPLIPTDARAAREARMRDRIFDNYVMANMQKLVFDRIRPDDAKDPNGVAEARDALDRTYDWLDGEMASREWAAGEAFSVADCAAAPALFYADWVRPFDGRENLIAYFRRLRDRPSFARCVDDARPARALFPGAAPKVRFEG
ncbi:glutathione S-transferase family protein [Methylopila sp. M107]|uniref:glutathione S-transferase family protein n=1 Tax=Methylopila sp. M107 TaxID=1101190 RepID=UPI00037589F2|nr:glutathione S-transferase family protein [Methylopila sp. M107]